MTTDQRDLDLLTRLAEKGVTYLVNITTTTGGQSLFLSPAQALRFARDPEGAAADALGVSVEDYRGWLESQGMVQCSATTRQGRRCRRSESGSGYDSPLKWAAAVRLGAHCSVHGGPGSGEA